MLTRVVLALLGGCLALVTLAQEPRPEPPSVPLNVPCPTCASVGTVDAECARCEGTGKGWCGHCRYAAEMQALRARGLALLQRRHAEELAEARVARAGESEEVRRLRELEVLLRTLPKPDMGVLRYGPAPYEQAELEPGRVVCVAQCAKGQRFTSGPEAVRCRACDAEGWIKCVACRGKGEYKCAECNGTRRAKRVCPECVGARERAVGHRVDVCPWCSGAVYRPCSACGPDGTSVRQCGDCDGTKETFCARCAGTQKARCWRCLGPGQLKRGALPGEFSECIDCQRTGLEKCDQCKRGKVACAACAATGERAQLCVSCGGARSVECAGCVAGSGRSWVAEGERLVAAGDLQAGVRWLEHGLARDETRFVRERDSAPDPAARRAVDLRLQRELERLKRRVAELHAIGN